MNRRSRHLLVLTVAVVTATVASLAMYRALLQRPVGAEALPNQRVVVARRAMAIGTQLTEADLKIVSWPADSPLPNAIGDMKDAVNRGLLTTVAIGLMPMLSMICNWLTPLVSAPAIAWP